MVLRIVPGGLEGRPPVRHFFGALGHKGHGNARTAGAPERLLPPPAFGRERGHRGLARRRVTMSRAPPTAAAFVDRDAVGARPSRSPGTRSRCALEDQMGL
jgi:hypothetical protein